MMNIRPFQIVLLGIFASFAVFGVIFFTMFNSSPQGSSKNYGEKVVVWGTLDAKAVDGILAEVSDEDKNFQVVDYIEKDERTFELDLLNAIAENRSPDLIILESDMIVSNREKLLAITYDTLSERSFRDRYIDGAEIFLFSEGIYGIPFAVDPLVMYWNRDLFSSAALANPPQTWENLLVSVVPALTRVGSGLVVTQSAVAFGEYANIRNAKAILSLLFLQAGSSIVSESERRYTVDLQGGRTQNGRPPAEAALSFYTGFALPGGAQYSWNRSLSEDRLQFTSGTLALYFGFGSEYPALLSSNPNLNFDIAPVPQDPGATVKRDFGIFYAFAIPRASANVSGAFAVAEKLAAPMVADGLAADLALAPVSRQILAAGTSNPYHRVLYDAALITRGWLDPRPAATEDIFRTMIEDVTSGRERVTKAVADAAGRLELAF